MKFLVIFCLLAITGVAVAKPSEGYTTRYDSINLQQILSNRRLLVGYISCALGEGKCTREGRELKSHITDALETQCAKCSDAQRRGTRTIIAHLINNEPEYWNKLKAKYDPTGKYTQKYEKELRTVAK